MNEIKGVLGCADGFQGNCASICGMSCEDHCAFEQCMWGCIAVCGNGGSCSADTRKKLLWIGTRVTIVYFVHTYCLLLKKFFFPYFLIF